MIVGFLDDIPFISSRARVRTFDEYSRQAESRWQEHDVMGGKPLLEFVGPGLNEISFKMLLRRNLGVNPEKEADKLRKLRDNGVVVPFIVGNSPVGKGFWIVKSVSEQTTLWSRFGHALSTTLNVTLKEYADETLNISVGSAWRSLL